MAMAQVKTKAKTPQHASALEYGDYDYGQDDYTYEETTEEQLLGLFSTGQTSEQQYQDFCPCGV